MITPDRVSEELGPVLENEGAPPGWEGRIATFVGELRDWNRRVNLVSRATDEDVLRAHVLPSLAGLLVVERDRAIRVLDVGSGGGFPGIPLRILRPRIRLDLVEATRKKCRFLEHCVSVLELSEARVHWCRIESPSAELQGRAPFDRAIARAVGDERRMVSAVRELLAQDGEAWVFAAPRDSVLRWADAGGRTVTGLRQIV